MCGHCRMCVWLRKVWAVSWEQRRACLFWSTTCFQPPPPVITYICFFSPCIYLWYKCCSSLTRFRKCKNFSQYVSLTQQMFLSGQPCRKKQLQWWWRHWKARISQTAELGANYCCGRANGYFNWIVTNLQTLAAPADTFENLESSLVLVFRANV